jgi:DNA-binding NarL/FixJ family response regulator
MFEVLIVDDEPLMREALEQMIGMVDGFEVCTVAKTGTEASRKGAGLSPGYCLYGRGDAGRKRHPGRQEDPGGCCPM